MKKIDERQHMELLKSEHLGFWVMWGILLVSIVVFAIGKYRNYESLREDVFGQFIPMVFIFATFLFAVVFVALAVSGEYVKHRERKIMEELDKELEEDEE